MTPEAALAAMRRASHAQIAALTERQREMLELAIANPEATVPQLAKLAGLERTTVRDTINRAGRVLSMEPEVAERLKRGGAADPSDAHSAWFKDKDGDSVYVYFGKNPNAVPMSIDDVLADTLAAIRDHAPRYDRPLLAPAVGHMVVVDLADLHVGKLATAGENGARYDTAIAAARARDGVARLMQMAEAHGVSSVVFVLGNDVLHTDDGKRTTNGTEQDTDGTWHEAFDAARAIYVEMIEQIAARHPVHLVFCPSNHDRRSGYALAQLVAAWFHNHPNVYAAPYYLSPRPRKYLVYGEALIGFTHMDGIKVGELPGLMQHEARERWGETKYAYWYTHHWHHKVRTRHGLNPATLEKDLTGMTVINGRTEQPGDSVEIEVLRSPSSPDGWHTLAGHVNGQAVECFLHGPDGAQTGRFTAWF